MTTTGGSSTRRSIPLEGLTPAKLWSSLDPPVRALAARALYRHDWGETDTRREADASIAHALRFRDAMVKKLPVDQRADYLAKAVRATESLAGSLLLALHLEHRRPMLSVFLDALGIPHDGGLIAKDHELTSVDSLALDEAAARLFREFPPDEVEIYLATLVAMDPDVWGGLAKSLESRAESGA